jgi:hypothetical protein
MLGEAWLPEPDRVLTGGLHSPWGHRCQSGHMNEPAVSTITHRFLGSMRRLSLGPDLVWDLTQQEAWTLARALIAVGHNHGLVEEVFLSPQGCDREFFAKVVDAGLMVETLPRPVLIAWPEVATLAEALSY